MDLEEIFQSCNNVVLPPEEKKIAINISAIRKIRYECACAKENKFTYAELWLGLSTLFLGAFFSALISKIPYKVNFLSIFFLFSVSSFRWNIRRCILFL